MVSNLGDSLYAQRANWRAIACKNATCVNITCNVYFINCIYCLSLAESSWNNRWDKKHVCLRGALSLMKNAQVIGTYPGEINSDYYHCRERFDILLLHQSKILWGGGDLSSYVGRLFSQQTKLKSSHSYTRSQISWSSLGHIFWFDTTLRRLRDDVSYIFTQTDEGPSNYNFSHVVKRLMHSTF